MSETEKSTAPLAVRSNAGLAGCDSEWIIYLKETGKYESYDAMCECHRCRGIRENFECWKPANVELTGGALSRSPFCSRTCRPARVLNPERCNNKLN